MISWKWNSIWIYISSDRLASVLTSVKFPRGWMKVITMTSSQWITCNFLENLGHHQTKANYNRFNQSDFYEWITKCRQFLCIPIVEFPLTNDVYRTRTSHVTINPVNNPMVFIQPYLQSIYIIFMVSHLLSGKYNSFVQCM